MKAGEAEGEATDKGGWERYSVDWRNFFECMLAPVARQAAGELLTACIPCSLNACSAAPPVVIGLPQTARLPADHGSVAALQAGCYCCTLQACYQYDVTGIMTVS